MGLFLVDRCTDTFPAAVVFNCGHAASSHQWNESGSGICHFLSTAFKRRDSLLFLSVVCRGLLRPYFFIFKDKETETSPSLETACFPAGLFPVLPLKGLPQPLI